ncbi:NAD(P)-dependent oxidoreductase [Acidiferrimicrobium sp. IK]|uniref:NAD(P)-dependent oxidoreductase n=1 Tax=Acidiferrimicrobium sp. IK TaxID=2871700 RepID=UPI0021CB04F3|nr:NAD(P)-dependent oxidoreductase [Acidiferrimicrobium sp. IK]MCU4184056.1 NAD(P)-dependent oxidoreductase [Acidiferrimicrobium sp. IK]
MTDLRVGFIGAGQMGMPMVERIHGAGLDVSVFARRAEVVEALTAAGIPHAASIPELAASVDVLCICTFSDAQLREVALGPQGAIASLLPGAVLVNHTTGSPALAEEMQASMPAGVGLVDAPVSGSSDQIRAGQLTVLAGADPGCLEAARPVMATYASTILHAGGVGDAQRVKLVNNLVFTVHLRIAALAAGIGQGLGIGPEALSRALRHCSGTSLPISMLELRPVDALVAGARPFLRKDVGTVRDVAAELGVDLGMLGELASWVDGPDGVDDLD